MSFFGIPIRNGVAIGIGTVAALRKAGTPTTKYVGLSHTLLQIGLTTPISRG